MKLFAGCATTEDLDRLAEGVRLLAEAVDRAPGDPEVGVWCLWLGLAKTDLAVAGRVPWDDAIGCLRRAAAGPPHPGLDQADVTRALATALRRRGSLLGERGDLSGSVEDLGLAAEYFQEALATDPDGDEVALVWYGSACVHRALGRLWESPQALDRAAECCSSALDHGLAAMDGSMAADAQVQVVAALIRRLERDRDAALVDLRSIRDAADVTVAADNVDAEGRAVLAGVLLELEVKLFENGPPFTLDLERFDRLYEWAAAQPDASDGLPLYLAAWRQFRHNYERSLTATPPNPVVETPLGQDTLPGVPDEGMRLLAAWQELFSGLGVGNRARIENAIALLDSLDHPLIPDEPVVRFLRTLADLGLAQGAADQTDRLAAVGEAVAALEPTVPSIQIFQELCAAILPTVLGRPAESAAVPLEPARPGDLIMSALNAFAAVMWAVAVASAADQPVGARHEAIRRAEQTVSAMEGGGNAATLTGSVLSGWLRIAVDTGSVEAVEAAVVWGERTVTALGGPRHPDWPVHALNAAEAYRVRGGPGDRRRAWQLGLSALEGHTWRVLSQSGEPHGLAVARASAADAQRVAEWCIEDGALDELVLALDAGRGLVLHAAVVTRSAAQRLTDLGEPALAAEWEAGGGDGIDAGLSAELGVSLRGDLRRRVLDTLTAGSADLLEPPHPDQIRAALHGHCSDALVYLVPGEVLHGGWKRPGRAVLVPATGPVEVVPLPELIAGPGSPLERYAQAYAAWHDRPNIRENLDAFEAWGTELKALTRWAGHAACDALLEVGHRLAPGREPRLVLVPVGALALVPWHASLCAEESGAPTPLVCRAVVSYIPSARLLCRAVGASCTEEGEVLVVADPDGSLREAGIEARAICDAFYPAATLLGWKAKDHAEPDGPGTVAEVLDWLRRPGRGRRVLHLACHGHAEPVEPIKSRLRLAGGSLLTAALLERPAESAAVERVFLATCSSNVTGLDYDEAFSIATAFLGGGARTVVGSLWTVPNGLTSKIMFVVHHHLEAEQRAPALALRQAQLWALDPDRVAPTTMPDTLLDRHESLASDDPIGWAGFVHIGF